MSLLCIAGYWNQAELAEVWFLQGNTGPGTWFVPVSSSTVLLWAGRAEPRPSAPRVSRPCTEQPFCATFTQEQLLNLNFIFDLQFCSAENMH